MKSDKHICIVISISNSNSNATTAPVVTRNSTDCYVQRETINKSRSNRKAQSHNTGFPSVSLAAKSLCTKSECSNQKVRSEYFACHSWLVGPVASCYAPIAGGALSPAADIFDSQDPTSWLPGSPENQRSQVGCNPPRS